MRKLTCNNCHKEFFSSAELKQLMKKECECCGGKLMQEEEERPKE